MSREILAGRQMNRRLSELLCSRMNALRRSGRSCHCSFTLANWGERRSCCLLRGKDGQIGSNRATMLDQANPRMSEKSNFTHHSIFSTSSTDGRHS
ncbi:hypothetical protein F7725_007324 [Dissostichus mawsoni]|uniref:Uncharacterized protein n=1 Tax=Dissostichus mawsoni TaxID=36200 RepID=A0A7J5XWI7_DISMA|nr:hypothetical protein F7725_007324 [Dissostichus mawsoni]